MSTKSPARPSRAFARLSSLALTALALVGSPQAASACGYSLQTCKAALTQPGVDVPESNAQFGCIETKRLSCAAIEAYVESVVALRSVQGEIPDDARIQPLEANHQVYSLITSGLDARSFSGAVAWLVARGTAASQTSALAFTLDYERAPVSSDVWVRATAGLLQVGVPPVQATAGSYEVARHSLNELNALTRCVQQKINARVKPTVAMYRCMLEARERMEN